MRCFHKALRSAAAHNESGSSRSLSILAWGRNVEHQCGNDSSILVTRPTQIIGLQGESLTSLHAGKLTSGAVNSHNEALTWGDGKAGKLGHGSAESISHPMRVESLVGRAEVANLALGDQHTLFLDTTGGLWACGENKEGQCGLGTPLEVIAAQHRKSFYESMRPASAGQPQKSVRGNREQATRFSRHLKSLQASFAASNQSREADSLAMFLKQAGTSGASATSSSYWQHHGVGGGSSVSAEGARMALGFGGFDFESHISASGLQPGQQHTPTRIGRDQHPLMEVYHKMVSDKLNTVSSSGLEHQLVTSVSASRYFSAAVTGQGEVWMFGACYNGSLGSHNSWSTSATKVSGALAATIEEHGGAVHVAAGGTFCVALTASGKVVMWGKVPGNEAQGNELMQMNDGTAMTMGHRLLVGVVPDLPPIKHIAAGQQHALMSDGERVWVIGRCMDATGEELDIHAWNSPQEVLHLPAEGVHTLTCGAHSSAVVTGDGELYMWGRLLDVHHAESLIKRYGSERLHDDMFPEDVRWDWSGFGAAEPSRVEGLSGVRAVALGGWHAMVAVD